MRCFNDVVSTTAQQALVCEQGMLSLEAAALAPLGCNELRIEVGFVGLCRTDLYAIGGMIPTKAGKLIPGHEFSGRVVEVGAGVNSQWQGKTVVVNPLFSCGQCLSCDGGEIHLCHDMQMMGVDRNGACQQFVAVDQSQVFDVGEMDAKDSAFAEPLAATLGVLNAPIQPAHNGLLLGTGRIAQLAQRLLLAKGFENITCASLDQARQISSSTFDFVIETGICTETMRQMVRLTKPHGVLILKSRQCDSFELCVREIVSRQQTIHLVHYGVFEEAVELLKSGRVTVSDLVGKVYRFRDIDDALVAASESEETKIFLADWS